MKWRSLAVGAALCTLVCCGGVASPQITRAPSSCPGLCGQVNYVNQDSERAPADQAVVVAKRNGQSYSELTDSKGRYSLALEPGAYSVTIVFLEDVSGPHNILVQPGKPVSLKVEIEASWSLIGS